MGCVRAKIGLTGGSREIISSPEKQTNKQTTLSARGTRRGDKRLCDDMRALSWGTSLHTTETEKFSNS